MKAKWLAAVALIVASSLSSPTAYAADVFVGNTRTALESLTVADESRAGYQRSLFKHWIDADGDGCNTRYEVLISEAKSKPRVGSGCRLSGGRWVSAYDGVQTSKIAALDIDHVVPLAEAWDSGASNWTSEQRMRFANDLEDSRSLIAVTATSNRQKSDRDPAEWLPARGRCSYLVQWVAVKVRWALAVDPAEKLALAGLIDTCGLASIRVTIADTSMQALVTPTASDAAVGGVEPSASASQQVTVTEPVYPGAFCAPRGATGRSAKGATYTCKPSDTDARNRWRR